MPARAAPALTVNAAAPATGPDATRPDHPAPNGTVRPFDVSGDLASPANGFARPAVAKDVIAGHAAIHAAAFVNDGLYGNGSSWIGASPDGWVKLDLGRVVQVDGVRFGRDRTGAFDDRDPGQVVVQLATADAAYAPGDEQDDTTEYTTVFDSAAVGFSGQVQGSETLRAAFTPTAARYVKVRVGADGAALDELEVSGQAEVDACASSPCGPDMACSDRPGSDATAAGRACVCAPGFVPSADGRCAMAGPVTLALAFAAPPSSPAARAMRTLAQTWMKVSGGRVDVKLISLGSVAVERDVVKKLRISQYRGALLSSVGLHAIAPEVMALGVPGLVRTPAERDQVLASLAPALEAALDAKGYVVLTWGELGATRVFSTVPRPTLATLQQAKLFTVAGDPEFVRAMTALGIGRAVGLSESDLVPSFNTGMVDTVVLTPAMALALGMDTKTRVMSDLVWSSLDQALIVDKATWLRIPQDLRVNLLAAAREVGAKLVRESRADEATALATLKARGAQVVPFTETAAWYTLLEQVYPMAYRTRIVPAATFDAIVGRLRELRAAPAPR